MNDRSIYGYRCRRCNRVSSQSIICLACGGQLRGNGEIVRSFPYPWHVFPLHRAPRKKIPILPRFTMNSGHLVNNTHCTVCLDQFEVGTEASEFPCGHIYHSNCITPWLANHVTCPVCRRRLPGEETTSSSAAGGRDAYVQQCLSWVSLLFALLIFSL